MVFSFSIDGCFTSAIGRNGIEYQRYAFFLSQAQHAADTMRSSFEDGAYPLLSVVNHYEGLDECLRVGEDIRSRFSHVVILGTGGSTLNPQAFLGLKPQHQNKAPIVHFLDNIDPDSTASLLSTLPLASTCFVVISKSGETLETLSQCLVCLEHCNRSEKSITLSEQFIFITEPKNSTLQAIASDINAYVLPHHTKVGGRFSSFTNVALLPAVIAGFDIKKFIDGGKQVLDQFLAAAPHEMIPALSSAAIHIALIQQGFCSTVRLSYIDRLLPFLSWQRQIWCESLGKDGIGTLYVPAQGTLDQHSQLQLYLGGKHDKSFTLFMLEHQDRTLPLMPSDNILDKMPYLKDKLLGDIMTAEQSSTSHTLRRHGCPVIEITLKELNEAVLGGLFMHSILEVLIIASLLGVNAFNQPAVEDGKVLAREFLAKMQA